MDSLPRHKVFRPFKKVLRLQPPARSSGPRSGWSDRELAESGKRGPEGYRGVDRADPGRARRPRAHFEGDRWRLLECLSGGERVANWGGEKLPPSARRGTRIC